MTRLAATAALSGEPGCPSTATVAESASQPVIASASSFICGL